MNRAIVVLAACLFTARAFAQVALEPYTWKNVKVIAGGYIPGIIFSRAEKGLAYCRTDIGGCYRWEDSAGKWTPMHDNLSESNYFGGESIAADPVDPNIVYIAAGMYRNEPAAILRSRDRGKTWEVFPVPFRMGGNEDGRGLGERLAIDPHHRSVLYFGSRHDGLLRSDDSGENWKKVESFPLKGLGLPRPGERTHGGLSFVAIDKTGQHVFVGSADSGAQHLFYSENSGESWKPVDGGPGPAMLPAKGQLDERGNLIVTYGNGIGPNGVTDGAVWKLNGATLQWKEISPERSLPKKRGGYCGLAISPDGQTIAVTTMDRWNPGDTVYRSTDGGETWHDIAAKATRDVSASPYLLWGDSRAKLGWWMSALAVDPFNPDRAAYATGATIYACDDFSNVSKDQPTHWRVWADGIEETAVITLLSPTKGAHLFSGLGDLGGFVHEDLDISPPRGMYDHPMFGNTNTLDFAEKAPNIVVRSGTPHEQNASLAWSEDGGASWHAIATPAKVNPSTQRRRRAIPALLTNADGSTFVLASPTPLYSRDRGESWREVSGLPPSARPVADRLDPSLLYALDFATSQLYLSTDAGARFTRVESDGLPWDLRADTPTSHEAPWPLIATTGRSGDLWFVSNTGLYHSVDRGGHFTKIETNLKLQALSFGKARAESDFPALFAIGTLHDIKAIWRSDDAGKTWMRINDDRHQYGTRFRCISGDPGIFGRVYVGTDGRGILYGDTLER